MAGIIGEAFVRVRPELSGFRRDLRSEASRSSHTFGKLIGASIGLGIGFGLERELEKTIDKAKEAEIVTKRLQAALRAQGLAWSDNGEHIEKNIQALSKLSSFEDEELKASFINILRTTNNVNKALELNALAADVARGRGLSLTTVSRALARAYNGQTASLSRLGITVKKGTTATEALRQVQAKYAGGAAAYANTAAGAQDRLNKTLDDSREIIGGALLPIITNLTTKFSDWLEKENESGDLQRKVNQYMSQGASLAHALASAFGAVKTVVTPLVNAVGGLGNALTLLFGFKIAQTVTRAVGSFGLLSTSVAATTTEGVAEAEAFDAAWTTATRNREMIVNTTTTGATPATTAAAGAGGGVKGAVSRGISQFGPLIAYSVAIGVLLRDTSGDPHRVGYVANGLPHAGMAIFYHPRGGYFTFGLTDERVDRETLVASQVLKPRVRDAGPHRGVAPLPGAETRGPGARGGSTDTTRPKPTITRLQNLRLALSAAERTGDLQAEKRIQANIVAMYQARVDNTKLTGAALYRFKTELGSEQDKAQSIQDQIDAENANKKAQRTAARQKRATDAQKKQDAHDTRLTRRLARGRRPFERAVERAQNTAGTKDDIQTAKALRDRIEREIKIVRASVQNTQTRQDELDRLSDEYAAAVTAVGEAKKKRNAALSTAAAASAAARTEQLDKIVQIAQLTDDPVALQHALDAAIKDAKRLLKKAQASGKGILDAYIRLYGLQKQKKDALKETTAGGGKQGTTAFDLLTQFGQQFEGGNLINADQPFVGPSGFVADIAQYMKRVKGGKYTYPSTATGGPGGGTSATTAIDKLIAALDRNTASKNDTTPVQGKVRAPKVDPHRVVSRGGGRYYESARARENVETRGGV